MAVKKLSELTVAELKHELKKRNLDFAGERAVLLARLRKSLVEENNIAKQKSLNAASQGDQKIAEQSTTSVEKKTVAEEPVTSGLPTKVNEESSLATDVVGSVKTVSDDNAVKSSLEQEAASKESVLNVSVSSLNDSALLLNTSQLDTSSNLIEPSPISFDQSKVSPFKARGEKDDDKNDGTPVDNFEAKSVDQLTADTIDGDHKPDDSMNAAHGGEPEPMDQAVSDVAECDSVVEPVSASTAFNLSDRNTKAERMTELVTEPCKEEAMEVGEPEVKVQVSVTTAKNVKTEDHTPAKDFKTEGGIIAAKDIKTEEAVVDKQQEQPSVVNNDNQSGVIPDPVSGDAMAVVPSINEQDIDAIAKQSSVSDISSLWISGLVGLIKASDLKQVFSNCGRVVSAKIVTSAKNPGSKCFGLVTMYNHEEAQKCIADFNNKTLLGSVVTVELDLKHRVTRPQSVQHTPVNENKGPKVVSSTTENITVTLLKKEPSTQDLTKSETAGPGISKPVVSVSTASVSKQVAAAPAKPAAKVGTSPAAAKVSTSTAKVSASPAATKVGASPATTKANTLPAAKVNASPAAAKAGASQAAQKAGVSSAAGVKSPVKMPSAITNKSAVMFESKSTTPLAKPLVSKPVSTFATPAAVTTTTTKVAVSAPAAKSPVGSTLSEKIDVSTSVWLSGLPSTIKAADLKALGQEFGKVSAAKVVASPKSQSYYGLITMSTLDEAKLCVSKLNGSTRYEKKITCELAPSNAVTPELLKYFSKNRAESQQTGNSGTTSVPSTPVSTTASKPSQSPAITAAATKASAAATKSSAASTKPSAASNKPASTPQSSTAKPQQTPNTADQKKPVGGQQKTLSEKKNKVTPNTNNNKFSQNQKGKNDNGGKNFKRNIPKTRGGGNRGSYSNSPKYGGRGRMVMNNNSFSSRPQGRSFTMMEDERRNQLALFNAQRERLEVEKLRLEREKMEAEKLKFLMFKEQQEQLMAQRRNEWKPPVPMKRPYEQDDDVYWSPPPHKRLSAPSGYDTYSQGMMAGSSLSTRRPPLLDDRSPRPFEAPPSSLLGPGSSFQSSQGRFQENWW